MPMTTRIRLVATWALAALVPWIAACDDGSTDGPDVEACEPEGEEGLDPGQVVPNVALTDCSGASVNLRALCSRTAAFVYAFAPW